MEIWLWIIAAWIVSYRVLDKEGVNRIHLLWMLLPVDMYGINILGLTVKPYMFFCVFILIQRIVTGRNRVLLTSPWMLRGLFICLACIVVNAVNCLEFGSLFSTAMMVVVWGCCLLYTSECDGNTRESVCKVLQATGIGYGLVFLVAYVFKELAPETPGVLAMTRADPGIFVLNANVISGDLTSAIRLRGFTIDPNTMLGSFLYCVLVSMFFSIRKKITIREIAGMVISILCILLSDSRMGLICMLLCILLGILVGFSINPSRARRFLITFGYVAVGILMLALFTGKLHEIVRDMTEKYRNRSGLLDEYGRVTIWKESIMVWIENGLFFGLGMGRMQYYTSMGRACHNSFLEALCAWGGPVGGALLLYFFSPIGSGLRSAYEKRGILDIFFWTMLFGTMGVMASLFTVDNITYSYLWFGLAMLSSLISGAWQPKLPEIQKEESI